MVLVLSLEKLQLFNFKSKTHDLSSCWDNKSEVFSNGAFTQLTNHNSRLGWLFLYGQGLFSANKINDDQVKHGVSEEEVSESPFWRDVQEIPFVLWIDLNP